MGINEEIHIDMIENYFGRLIDIVENKKLSEVIQEEDGIVLPTVKELHDTAKILEVDVLDFYYTGYSENSFVYIKGFFYLEIRSFDKPSQELTRIKDNIKEMQRLIEERVANNKFGHIFLSIPKKFKVIALRDLYEQNILTTKEFYEIFRSEYQMIESGFTDEDEIEFLEEVLRSNPDKGFRKKITADENDMVTIYRGVGPLSKGIESGYSWTLRENVAHFFASRTRSNGVVYRAKVHKQDILDYITDRKEEEVLVFPDSVIDAEIIHKYGIEVND